jgi:hypothetical protein
MCNDETKHKDDGLVMLVVVVVGLLTMGRLCTFDGTHGRKPAHFRMD